MSAEFGELPPTPRPLPEFIIGDHVAYATRTNVGYYHARIVAARYSQAWQVWLYDLAVFGDSVDNIVQCVMQCNLVRAR